MSRIWMLTLGVALFAASALAVFTACGGDEEADGERLSVVVSTQVIADWTRQVGGDLVSVRALVPAGADAHTFELTVEDIRAVTAADLVIINGAGLEASYESAVEENASNVLELASAVEALGMELEPFEGMLGGDEEHHQQEQQQQEQQQQAQQEEHEHDHAGEDPHFWFDTDIARAAVTAIAAELSRLNPDAADQINERRDAYREEIAKADREVRDLLADLPAGRRLLVTFHDAFGYFARRYGLVVAGFVVEGPEQGVSADAITGLIELIEHEGVETIFHEPQFDSNILDTIAGETGVEQSVIWSQPTDAQPTYIDILLANARAIADQ